MFPFSIFKKNSMFSNWDSVSSHTRINTAITVIMWTGPRHGLAQVYFLNSCLWCFMRNGWSERYEVLAILFCHRAYICVLVISLRCYHCFSVFFLLFFGWKGMNHSILATGVVVTVCWYVQLLRFLSYGRYFHAFVPSSMFCYDLFHSSNMPY